MEHLELGSDPIEFSLKGTDNKIYSLNDFNDKDYIAIMFSCNHCPYVVASEAEFNDIQRDFDDIFTFIAINPNVANPNYPGDSFANMIERANEKGFKFPYLADETQGIARLYGAGRTPEIFLYNKQRKLIYKGRINDNPKFRDQVTRHDLRVALEELRSGKTVSLPETQALGCSIKFVD